MAVRPRSIPVVAITDRTKGARGASMFVVEEGDPGFRCGPKEKKMGIRASSTTRADL